MLNDSEFLDRFVVGGGLLALVEVESASMFLDRIEDKVLRIHWQ
jgi:hypothetical protein